MGKPKAPTPPDPAKTAAAQTGTNVATAIANAQLGNVNQITPEGSLTFDQTGTFAFTDPSSGQTFDIPQFTATQALTPEQQQLFNTNLATQQNLANIGQQQSGFFEDFLSQPFQGSNEAVEARLFDLGRQRLDPVFDERRQALEQDLANRGIGIGSAAHETAFRQFGEQQNDAFNQLALTGRGQAFSEAQALRNQPINELSALLSQTQVSQPNFITSQQPTIPTTDFAGLVNENFRQQQANFANQQQQQQQLLGGLFGLGSSALIASDKRVKEDVEKIGKVKGHNVYEYRYKGQRKDSPKSVGFMAQEVERKSPGAVANVGDMKLVDYAKALGV